MAELEGIKIPVDSKDVERATKSILDFVEVGEKSENKTRQTSASWRDSMNIMGKSVVSLVNNVERMNKSMDAMLVELRRASDETRRTSNQFMALGGAMQTLLALFATNRLIEMTSMWTDLNSTMVVSTGSAENAAYALERIQQIAKTAYADLGNTAQIFMQNKIAMDALGYSMEETLNFTESVTNALIMSGVKGEQAANVTRQMAQILAKGKADMADYNSMVQQGTGFMELLAKGMGVNIIQLRQMATEGQLTGAKLAQAMSNIHDEVTEGAKAMPATLKDAITNFTSALTVFVGETNTASGVANKLVIVIDFLSDNIDLLAKAAVAMLGIKMASYFIGLGKSATIAAQSFRLAALEAGKARAVMSLMGGPVGIITSALTIGATAWMLWGGEKDKATANLDDLRKSTDDYAESLRGLHKVQLEGKSAEKAEQIDNAIKELEGKRQSLVALLMSADNTPQMGGEWAIQLDEDTESIIRLVNAMKDASGTPEELGAALDKVIGRIKESTSVSESSKNGLIQMTSAMYEQKIGVERLREQADMLVGALGNVGTAANQAKQAVSGMTDADFERLMATTLRGAAKEEYDFNQNTKNATPAQTEAYRAGLAAAKAYDQSQKRGSGARQESQFAKDMADIQAQKAELDMLISLREKYGMQAESLTAGEKKIYELEAQLGLKQVDRHGKLSDAQIQQLIREQGLLSEQQKAYDLLTKQKQLEAEIEKFRQAKSDSVSESLIDLENESAMLFMSADARKVLSAQMEQEAEVRKFIAEQKRNGAKVDPALEAQLIAEAKARGQVAGAIEAQKIALAGARELYEANEKFAIDFILDEDERNRRQLEKEADLWRQKIELAGAGTETQMKLIEQFDVWYRNRQIAPEVERVKKAIESFESDFHTAFLDITTGGDTQNAWKTFTKSLGASLKTQLAQALYETFIKKYVVNTAINMVGGDVGDALRGGSGGSGAGGALNNVSSGFSIGNSLYGAGNFLGLEGLSVFGANYGAAAGTFGSLSGAASMFEGGTALIGSGQYAAGFGQLAGTALPYVGIALAAYSLLGNSFKGETRSGGTWETVDGKAQFKDGPSGGPLDKSGVETAINATFDSINGLLKAAGSQSYLTGFHAALETSGKGRGGVLAGGMLSNGVMFGEDLSGSNYKGTYYENTSSQSVSAEEAIANFTLDLKQATIQALQAAGDIPAAMKKMIDGIDAEGLTSDAADALLEAINAQVSGVNTLKSAMLSLPFVNLKNLSYDAAAGLIEFSGGIEALMGNLDGYYQKYYTEAERTGALGDQLKRSFYELNLVMPTSKAQFRSIVESIDVTTESGQRLYAQMMGLSGAFADYQDAFQQGLDNALSLVQQAYDRETAAIRNAISAHEQFIKSIDDLIYSLKMGSLSPLTPEQKYMQGKSELDALIAKAEGGDEAARQQIPDMISKFLEISQGYNASSQQYQDDFSHYVAEAERLRALAVGQLDIERSQLAKLDAMVLGILSVNESVISLKDALANYQSIIDSAPGGVATGSSIDQIYQDLFGRNADAAGLAYWNSIIANNPGVSNSQLEAWIRGGAKADDALKLNGSHFNGLDYVPFDGYIAELHKGERVLTARENQALSSPAPSSSGSVLAELRGLRADNAALRSDNAKLEARLASIEENQRAQISQQSAIAQKDTREREEIADASRGRAVTAL